MHGEVGVSGVAVWLGLPAMTLVRAPGFEPRVVHTRGGLSFHTEDSSYDATRLKPIRSSRVTSRDWLGELHAACRERGLALRALVNAGRLGRVASRHTEMACKNVWGAASEAGVCLTNADVRGFFYALMRDVSNRGQFDSIVLVDGLHTWAEAWREPAPAAISLGPLERAALSMCFCESCLQSAQESGVDATAARRATASLLDAFFDTGSPGSHDLSHVARDNDALHQWLCWRGRSISALWRSLAEASACPLVLAAGDDVVRSTFAELDDGGMDGVQHVLTVSDDADSSSSAGSPERPRELSVPAGLCVGDRSPELVAAMVREAEAGCSTFQIDGDAVFTADGRATVKQAVRFVRRCAS